MTPCEARLLQEPMPRCSLQAVQPGPEQRCEQHAPAMPRRWRGSRRAVGRRQPAVTHSTASGQRRAARRTRLLVHHHHSPCPAAAPRSAAGELSTAPVDWDSLSNTGHASAATIVDQPRARLASRLKGITILFEVQMKTVPFATHLRARSPVLLVGNSGVVSCSGSPAFTCKNFNWSFAASLTPHSNQCLLSANCVRLTPRAIALQRHV
jgi:hypothetical protein